MTTTQHTNPTVIGRSVEDRAIELYTFNFNPDVPDSRLNTLLIGAFHGDEGISTELITMFLKELLEHPRTIETEGISAFSFGVIPALNPDGLERNHRLNANGVDLNRNWPSKNWVEENQDTIYYSGKSAGSEPETKLLLNVLETYKPQKIVSIHSPYKVINFDGPAKPLANAMATYSNYPVTDDIGYETRGSFGTYCGIERNIPTITLELPEDESLADVWRDNRGSLYEAIRF